MGQVAKAAVEIFACPIIPSMEFDGFINRFWVLPTMSVPFAHLTPVAKTSKRL